MRSLLKNPLWLWAKKYRARQRLTGWLSGILLALAMLALFDGLIAQMRQDANELELLPGQAIAISGPCAVKNPLPEDLNAQFTPANAPLVFELEGYFAGFWFGNGMWRGKIAAEESAQPGEYGLSIAFRGANSATAQQYLIRIFAGPANLRAASLSFITRLMDINPFLLAAVLGSAGIGLGLLTWWFGSRFYKALPDLGLAEIFASDPEDSTLWCFATKELAPRPGQVRMVLDRDGHVFGEARCLLFQKGRLKLILMDERKIPPGSLVCLRHPADNPQKI
ncbi:MAG: hypothetical protein HDQ44_01415 [Desulfovibrio sp.]|nr:hypothetical protein [Desulfovibrio sp.]